MFQKRKAVFCIAAFAVVWLAIAGPALAKLQNNNGTGNASREGQLNNNNDGNGNGTGLCGRPGC